jgi:hypothetical protein
MMKILPCAFLLTTSVFAGTTSIAASPESAADVRCLIVAFNMENSTDPKVQAAGHPFGMYFYGRLDGREPTLDLQKAITEQLKAMTPELLRSEAQRCGQLLVERANTMQSVSNVLQSLPH